MSLNQSLADQLSAIRNDFRLRISPELKVILDFFDVQRSQPIQRPKDFSFEQFLKLIARHRIHPILSDYIDELKHILSDSEMLRLKEKTHAQILKQMHLTRVLFNTIKLFSHKNIEAIPIKGPLLSYQLFSSFSSRESIDLDLLILQENLQEVHQLLKSEGFSCEYDLSRFKNYSYSIFLKNITDLQYTRASDHVKIEIHWKLFEIEDTFYKSTDELFETSEITEINQVNIRTLNKEDHINYLTIHGAKHDWFRLKWLLDIRQILLSEESTILWENLRKSHVTTNTYSTITSSVALSAILFKTEIFKELYKQRALQQQLIQSCNEPLRKLSIDNLNHNPHHRLTLYKRLNKRKRGDFKIFYNLIFSSEDWKIIPLPHYLFWLYIPLRPFLYIYRKVVNHMSSSQGEFQP